MEKELEQIKQSVLEMGRLAVESVQDSVQSLIEENLATAEKVRIAEKQVDRIYDTVRRQLFVVCSRHTPVASDLRMVINSADICAEVERIVDYANNIAKLYQRVLSKQDLAVIRPLWPKLEKMSQLAVAMLVESLSAYENKRDVLDNVRRMDVAVDSLNAEMFFDIVAVNQRESVHTDKIALLLHINVIVRYLERVADRAINIAEQVRHLVTGFPKLHA